MTTKNLIFIIISCAFFSNCAVKTATTFTTQYPPIKPYEGFVIFQLDDNSYTPTAAERIGQIKIQDNGFSINCDYQTVLDSACNIAKRAGANAIKITDHKLPDPIRSTCHRISAEAYRIQNLKPYEKEIFWNTLRPLCVADFKADTSNRPFQAVTFSNFKAQYVFLPRKNVVNVRLESFFLCKNSYFKPSKDSVDLLRHEQGHFDITEINVRKLRKKMQEQTFQLSRFASEIQRLFDATSQDIQTMQDKYDHDLYAKPSLLNEKLAEIKADLEAYHAYSSPEFQVKLEQPDATKHRY